MMLFLILMYVIVGALIGGTYYYLQLQDDKYNLDMFAAAWSGILWPVVAPFTFAFYFAKKMSRRK